MPRWQILQGMAVALFMAWAPVQAGEAAEQAGSATATEQLAAKQGYAPVNGLKMYYEIHGTGRPLVVLHGAFGRALALPDFGKSRQLIAVELQGHGHTGDIDRPLAMEQLADDVAALVKHLNIEQADFFGYSLGGTVALGVAIRHPKMVRKLAINGSHFGKMEDAYDPAMARQFKSLSPSFAPSVLKDPYVKIAPDPSKWPVLVSKIRQLGIDFKGYSREDMRSIKAPVLITLGDRDAVRPEHAVEMYRLIPNAQLAIFPRADHFLIFNSPGKLFPLAMEFFDGPQPAAR